MKRILTLIFALLLLFISLDILVMRWGFSQIPGQVPPWLVYATLLVNSGLAVGLIRHRPTVEPEAMTKTDKS